MCKDKGEQTKNKLNDQVFDGPVKYLIWSCIILVGAVILWIAVDSLVNISYRNKVVNSLDKIDYITVDAIQTSDSLLVLTGKDIKDMLDDTLLEEATLMDSNNYLAIILTLITLCVSLSVVIPYIVGRSISAKTIKDTVDDLYEKDKNNSDQQYKRYVDKLLLAEGHLSRMISYLLLHSSKDKYSKTLSCSEYDEESHPYWAIGWASKSLIRYIKSDSRSYKSNNSSFIVNCVKYIVDANAIITCNGISASDAVLFKDKIERAFVDITDVMGYSEHSRFMGALTGVQKKEIEDAAKKLYLTMIGAGFKKSDIIAAGVKKSKYEDFITSVVNVTPTADDYEKHLNGYIKHFES